ncbi:MAG: thioredoxin domain-containing protein [Candidatus Omnitrophica bacterium]|nr:thioredoxin domain-containing protein [Candidatus Omnitrophota bacterium]
MDKKISILILVVLIGVAFGVGIVSLKYNNDVMQSMFETQNEILKTQKAIQKYLDDGGGGPLQTRVAQLEGRVESMEQQWDSFGGVLNQLKAANSRQAQQPSQPSDEYTKVHDIPVKHSPIIGKKNASITIVEFVDFQCPFCARFHQPIVEVLEAYPNDVNYLVKNFPLSFHPQARPGSKVALAAAEQGKYQEMVDLILSDNQNLSDEKYREFAKKIGLNMKKFEKSLAENDAKYEDYIRDDMQLGASVGVRGTPTFFINGRKTVARDFASFKREIDAILEEK